MAVLTRLLTHGPKRTQVDAGRWIPLFETSALLGANAVFETPLGGLEARDGAAPAAGDAVALGPISEIKVMIAGHEASAAGGIEIKLYGDPGATTLLAAVPTGYPKALSADTPLIETLAVAGAAIRVKYTNGATPQTRFSLRVLGR